MNLSAHKIQDRLCYFIIIDFLLLTWGAGCVCLPERHERVFKDIDTEKQIDDLQNRLKSDTANIALRIELGKIYLSENMLADAAAEFESVLHVDSQNIEAYLLLASAILRLPNGDLNKASGLLEKAVRIAPESADLHLRLAQVYLKQGKEENAVREFKKTVELPGNTETLVSAYLELMAIYRKKGETGRAGDMYEKAKEINPGIDEIIRQTEINRITPHPESSCKDCKQGDGIHPELEDRIKNAREKIEK